MSCRALVVALAALVFTACNSARKLEPTSVAPACTRCHGDPARPDGAPPRDLRGDDDTTSISVGAHASHLTGSHGIAAPVPCEACHVVPASAAVGHPDGRVEVTFGAVARPGGAPASWDRAGATCSVYCHGATLPGGAAPPVWTRVDGTQVTCDRCHGNPPARPHPQRSDCRTCHPATVDAQGAIDVAGGRHVDGLVERELHGCTDCHGDAGRGGDDPLLRAAPPAGAGGERATTERPVGAHQAHLVAGNVSRPVACAECHAVPAALDHSNGVADVAFGPLATRGDAGAAWDREAASCAATYCHGATLQGGAAKAPVWTRVDGTQRRCDACHGAPPPAPHPAATTCSTCHPGTVRGDGSIDVANGLHLNGEVDSERFHASGWADPSVHGRAANRGLGVCKDCHGADLAGGAVGVSCDACHAPGWRSTCTFCHGDPNRATSAAAPPEGTQGETSPAERAVGAHAAHLQDGPLRSALECRECHEVPVDLSHVDGTRRLVFGELATTAGAQPRFEGGRCSASYCHGATLAAGGTGTSPSWTGGAAEAACGTCHGAPPPAPHPQLTACQLCHAATVTSPTTIDVAGGKHVDGAVEARPYHPDGWSEPFSHGRAATRDLASCKGCHGEALDGGPALVSCASCHGAGWQDDCTFCHGDRSRGANGAAPPRGTQGELETTARAVGAHGPHLAGSALGTPVACRECHAVPADLSHVDRSAAVTFGALASSRGASPRWDGQGCAGVYCHGATLGASIAPAWTRVDGTQAACGTCHAAPPPPPHPLVSSDRTGCATCHERTVDASGALVPAAAGGAHLDGAVDASRGHEPSWMDRTSPGFHARAANQGLGPCQACHGASLEGGPTGGACARCHGAGWKTACTGCHGGGLDESGAPPRATWGNDADPVRVGAHASHVAASALAPAFDCGVCHVRPADALAAGHLDGGTAEVVFSGLAARDVAPGTWDRASGTCGATYCHGATLGGGTNPTPQWTRLDGTQAACGTCHGAPPPYPHPAASSDLAGCAACHGETVSASGAVIPPASGGKHLDGLVEASRGHAGGWLDPASPEFHARAANADLLSCQGCHGADLEGGTSGKACGRCHGPDFKTTCTSCHGGASNATGAPPRATWGNAADPVRAGAHSSHVEGSATAPAFPCAACHVRPADALAPGHVDGGTAEVTFGGLAALDVLPAPWDRASPTCASTYCHGATLGGGTNKTPDWTRVDGTQAACGSCHGLPPPAPAHPAVGPDLAGCAVCHGETMTASGALIPPSAGGRHVDGLLEVSSGHGEGWMDRASARFHAYSANAGLASCRFCHGDDLGGGSAGVACATCHGADFRTRCTSCHGGTANATGAPPRPTWGNPAPQAIGAHGSHVSASHALAAPVDCAACHAKPLDALSAGHADGDVAVTGYTGTDPALRAVVTDPGYARSGAGASCATSYCHGATLQGGTNRTPQWTRTDGTQAACGTCHGRPPLSGPDVAGYPAHRFHTYRKGLACQTCHDGYTQTSAVPATHVNGVRDVRVRHLVCAPQGCDPSLDPDCACTEQVANVVGWDCGGCHSKFTF